MKIGFGLYSQMLNDEYYRLEALDSPIPNGMVWNMMYDPNAPEGYIATIGHEELMDLYTYFLDEMIPVAEEANVKLALHPDDPPLQEVRKQPRIGYHPDHYNDIMMLHDSPNHVMELCLGTISEMKGSDVYAALENFAKKTNELDGHALRVDNGVGLPKLG